MCPYVEVAVHVLEQPTALTFVFLGGPGQGPFSASFDIYDAGQSRVIAATSETSYDASPVSRTNLAVTLVAVFGHAGSFAIRCLAAGAEQFRFKFEVARLTDFA